MFSIQETVPFEQVIAEKSFNSVPILPEDAELLGEGQYGAVFRVYDSRTRSHVAMKRIPNHLVNRMELSLCSHALPNLVPILSLRFDSAYSYLSMPEMIPLNKVLRPSGGYSGKPLKLTAVRTLALDLMRGLHSLHSLGLVHNDVKSDNVLFHHGHYFLTDFGMVKFLPSTGVLYQCPENGIASPLYRCPQSVAAQRSNGYFNAFALDIWSLGVLLYEAAVGRFPIFPDDQSVESLFDLLLDIAADKINLSEICDDFIREIVEKLLTIDRSDRMSNFDELCLRFL
ncbi:hypothetical protein RCL1_004235 [Eukaryota sp. TZLM3-RCL]